MKTLYCLVLIIVSLGYSANVETKTVLYQEGPTGHRMVYVTLPKDSNDFKDMVDCVMIGDKSSASKISADEHETVNKANMTKIINACSDYQKTHFDWSKWATTGDKDRSFLDGLMIFPGTKYCGAGNISESYNDLGADKLADACCRKHDSCNDSIAVGEEKHGIKNPNLLTANECSCDNLLYDCLSKANTLVSNAVGIFYFNVFKQKCFTYSYPINGCDQYEGIRYISDCKRYSYDTRKPKEWKFVDPKFFNPLNIFSNLF